MKNLFRRKSEKLGMGFSRFMELYKRMFADYLNSKVAGFTATQNKVLLLVICILFISTSLTLFIKVIF